MAYRIRRALGYLSLTAFGAIAVLAVLVMVDQSLPFAPYHIYSYRIEQKTLCPDELVRVQLKDQMKSGYRVDHIDVRSTWRSPGAIGQTAQARIPISHPWPPRTRISPLLRYAPEVPGQWTLHTETTVYGRRFLFPDRQEVSTHSQPVEVKACNHD